MKEDINPECVTPFLGIFFFFGGEVHSRTRSVEVGDEDGVVGFFPTSRRSAAVPTSSPRATIVVGPSIERLAIFAVFVVCPERKIR